MKRATSSSSGELVLRKIISGGQTGADKAGLDAAVKLGFETGGTAPPNFQTSNGPDRSLISLGLTALPPQASLAQGYVKRSIQNVNDADATVVFRTHSSAGTDKTIGYCVTGKWKRVSQFVVSDDVWVHTTGHRPVIVISRITECATIAFREFLREYAIKVLNVAGHRESRSNQGWHDCVYDFLWQALTEPEVPQFQE